MKNDVRLTSEHNYRGALGFLGRFTMEKLLRCCPEITTIYLLIRVKNQQDPQTRFKKYFNDVIFDKLKREQKDVGKKIILMEGDKSQLNLELSKKDRERIKDTDLIFHSAASVRFIDNISFIVNTNIRRTRDLLLLAQEMTSLKAIIEDTIRQYCNGIPTCIVRPSIVVATEKEPIAGLINNLYRITDAGVGIMTGFIHTMYCNENFICDIIPADYVVNNIIAAAWEVAEKQLVFSSFLKNLENLLLV
ncbi:hypothetical protein M0804_013474 [Polistes exclamans]|nr:hypothetical protein M0804_013474 [Polistes exclamans]